MINLDEQVKRNLPHAVIVEDDLSLSNGYRLALESIGYFVKVFGNGRDALDYFETIVPHLILLDIHLPGVTGDKIIQILRDKSEFDVTRIFFATADARLSARYESKADLVLLKPIGFTALKNLASRYKPKTASSIVASEESGSFTQSHRDSTVSSSIGRT